MFSDFKLPDNDRPVYLRLADAISERIERGELSEGDRLPPQRDLARALGINVTTVTRAFSTLQRQGLIEARPGRGSTIASRDKDGDAFKSAPSDEAGLSDLSINRPATSAYLDALAALMPRLAKDKRFTSVRDYHPPEGPTWARTAIADWLGDTLGEIDPGRIILTDGAQHGLACILRAISQRGDVIVADSITYQGISALCRSLELDLRGLAADRDGMRPEAFEAACVSWRPRAVFLIPSLHNPTTVTLSEERRRAIAAIARRHNVLIIEDDVYRPLLENTLPTFASIEPELTIYVGALSKCVAPGLRYGFVVPPRAVLGHVAASLRIDCWSISPLTALIATVFLEDGSIRSIIERQRDELRLRQAVLLDVLGRFDVQTHPISAHAWLNLPEPWRGAGFARVCRQRGVGVLPADAFAVGRETVAHAVRINLGAAQSAADLRRALSIIADILHSGDIEISGSV